MNEFVVAGWTLLVTVAIVGGLYLLGWWAGVYPFGSPKPRKKESKMGRIPPMPKMPKMPKMPDINTDDMEEVKPGVFVSKDGNSKVVIQGSSIKTTAGGPDISISGDDFFMGRKREPQRRKVQPQKAAAGAPGGMWKCEYCEGENEAKMPRCPSCGAPRKGVEIPPELPEVEFVELIRSLQECDFDNFRVEVLDSFKSSSYSWEQVRSILACFDFDNYRVEALRCLRGLMVNPRENVSSVLRSFDFDNYRVEAADLLR